MKKDDYQKLRDLGWTYQAIAEKYGVSRQNVYQSLNFKKKTSPLPKLK
jgi:DNA invertase Pin-like site-specific DNA recombinase